MADNAHSATGIEGPPAPHAPSGAPQPPRMAHALSHGPTPGVYPTTLLPAHPMASPQYAYYTDYNGTALAAGHGVSSPPHSPSILPHPMSPYASPGATSPYLAHSPPSNASNLLQSPPTSPYFYYNQFVQNLDSLHGGAHLPSGLTSPAGSSVGGSLVSPRGAPLSPSYPSSLMMQTAQMLPLQAMLSPTHRDGLGSRRASDPAHSNTNVYIRNLPSDMTDEMLNKICSAYGKITSSKAILDENTQVCKGFGFVMYETTEETNQAIAKLNEAGYQAKLAKESFKTRLKNMQDKTSTNVYISNLPVNMTEGDLVTLFENYSVVSPRILRKEDGQTNRGVGFVRLADRESALKLIRDFNGKVLPGGVAPLQLRFADSAAQKKLKRQSSRRRPSRSKEGEPVVRSPRDQATRLPESMGMSPVYYQGMPHGGSIATAMFPPMYAAPPPFPHFPMAPVYHGMAMASPYPPSIDQLTSAAGHSVGSSAALQAPRTSAHLDAPVALTKPAESQTSAGPVDPAALPKSADQLAAMVESKLTI